MANKCFLYLFEIPNTDLNEKLGFISIVLVADIFFCLLWKSDL